MAINLDGYANAYMQTQKDKLTDKMFDEHLDAIKQAIITLGTPASDHLLSFVNFLERRSQQRNLYVYYQSIDDLTKMIIPLVENGGPTAARLVTAVDNFRNFLKPLVPSLI